MLARAAAGSPPPADGSVTVVPRAAGGAVAAVLGFTAHHVVAADVDPRWVRSVLPAGSLSAPMSARFLAALADRVGAEPGAYDVVLVAAAGPSRSAPRVLTAAPSRAADGQPSARTAEVGPRAAPLELRPVAGEDHARLRRAERYRSDVRAYGVEGGLLVLGRGLAGRWEVSLEVDPAYRGRGLGRRLIAAAPPWSRPAHRSGRRSRRPTSPRCAPSSPPATPRSAPRCCSPEARYARRFQGRAQRGEVSRRGRRRGRGRRRRSARSRRRRRRGGRSPGRRRATGGSARAAGRQPRPPAGRRPGHW